MAAAEYYSTTAAQAAPHHSPYQQSPYQQPHELQGSPVPYNSLGAGSPTMAQQTPPPPYQAMPQDHKPAVHFAPNTPPSRNSRPGSGRPSFSQPVPQNQAPIHHTPPRHLSYSSNRPAYLHPQVAMQPPHMRPYMNPNQSEYAISPGYASDPEPRRRRRHKQHEHRDEESRDVRPRKHRSRSSNADSLIGAAGGGLIGDLIFPGLGTVGGAVAGWLGGKEHNKHKNRKADRLHRDQAEWEDKFRSRSHSGDRRHS